MIIMEEHDNHKGDVYCFYFFVFVGPRPFTGV
jgi:hypothetical protein